jgi:hypothetical protein
MAISSRSQKMYVVEETTVGTLKAPTSGAQAQPIRPGDAITPAFESLANDEIINSLAAGKPILGKESPTGSHPAYAKHSGVEGQAPEAFVMYESAFGSSVENATQYSTIAASTTTVLKSTGASTNFLVGQSLLIKDATNGYRIRAVKSLSGTDITLNFAVPTAPASGVGLGKAQFLKPATSGHPSFSVWKEGGSAEVVEAVAGARTTSIAINATAGQQVEANFEYAGSKYYFNPMQVTASNNVLSFEDDVTTYSTTVAVGFYSPVELAEAVASAMNAVAGDEITVSYDSTLGKFTLASDGSTTFEIDFTVANSMVQLGFTTAQTGAFTYTGSVVEHEIPGGFTASYDDVSTLVAKNIEFLVGTATNYQCRPAQSVSVTIAAETVDVDSICEESGVQEKLPNTRTATFEATLVLEAHEAHLFDYFYNNDGIGVQLNLGSKDSSGNWEAGKCMSVTFIQAIINRHELGGDDFMTLTLAGQGYVSTSIDDIYLSFL